MAGTALDILRGVGSDAPTAPTMPRAPGVFPRENMPRGTPVLDILAGAQAAPPQPALQGAMRFVTSALSPLQAPQDLLFATAGGLLNPYKSPLDYYRDIEWAHYSPFNRAPARPVDGETLARMSGVTDRDAQHWVGLGLDFLADPMLGGMAVRAVGKATNAAGLMRLADRMDTLSEVPMLIGGVPTARVASAARGLPGFRQFDQAVNDNFVQQYVMPVAAWADRTTARWPGGQPMRAASGQEFSVSGMFDASRGRIPGAQNALSRVEGAAEEVSDNTSVLLMQAMAAVGDPRWKTWLNRQYQAMAVRYDLPVQTINNFSPVTSRALMNNLYTTAEEVGYVTLRDLGQPGVRSAAVSPVPSDLVRKATVDIDFMENVIRNTPLNASARSNMRGRISRYEQAKLDVGRVAADNGDDANLAMNAFDEALTKFQQASAVEGYFGSGYGIMHEVFLENMAKRMSAFSGADPLVAQAIQKAGGEANVTRTAWRRLLRGGAQGIAESMLDNPVPFAGANLVADAQRPTYRDLFSEFKDLPGLNIGTWLDSLTRGHMRRTFGVFHDETSWRAAVDGMKAGRVTPTKIIDDHQVLQNVATRGFTAEAQVARKYIDDITPRASSIRATGGFVRQEDLVRHMVDQGIPVQRAEEFYSEMIRQADPHISDLAERLRQYGSTEIGDPVWAGDKTASLMGARATLSARRQSLDGDQLSTLMEMMDPVLSRAETAIASTRALRKQEGLATIYKLAKDQGLIVPASKAASVPKWWKAVSNKEADAFPMMAGHYVHPTVLREMRNLVTVGANSPGALSKVRSVITAGYLANPATTTANVAGGFWTAALMGVNPMKLAGNMVEVYRDWKKMGRELPELRDMRDVMMGGAASSELIRFGGDLRVDVLGVKDQVGQISGALSEGARKYQEFLRRPGGVGALGLGLFEASEALFRLGTYRMVMKATGDADEARRMARFIVFDYANQPGSVQLARDTGFFLFPAFPYFMFGRTLNAAVNRPGLLAAGDRSAELITNMQLKDEDDRIAMHVGMQDWEREDKYVPVRVKDNGDVTTLSWNQLFPTNTMTGRPFLDSLASAGLWGPMFDLTASIMGVDANDGDPGEGRFTGAYGRRTLPTGVGGFSDDPAAALAGWGSFMWNSFAPGIARKTVRPPEDVDQQWMGLAPSLIRGAQTLPAEWADAGRTAQEMYSRRVDQDVWDALISSTIRSTRAVATSGPLASVTTVLTRASSQLERELSEFDRQISAAQSVSGNEGKVALLQERRARKLERWQERWGPVVQEAVRMRDVERRFDPPGR